jgi:asparagine synthase (glutamine-hydrolysing)
MCGICGFAGGADDALVRAMTEMLHHRGPDGDGVRCFASEAGRPPAALGHRRLAIIDPTPRGAQPMSYGDGRFWITYNGELYNYRELRRMLDQQGFGFHSECDTEVLLAMYARDGVKMLDSLNGIFAFAIWDAERGELFLARDRLGVKPLYYATADGVFYFASEVKALLPALSTPRLRHDSVADFLTFLWVPDPSTMFEGIHKLPAGHYATWAAGSLDIQEYWDMSFAPEARPESEWVEEVRQKVAESVRRQMVSDVPLGSFLSGGLDSSTVVAEMASNGPVTTYTVGFSGEDLAHEIVPDDLRYSRQIAAEFDIDYHERILEPEVTALLPKLVWHMDEPVADPAGITTFLICSAARERLTVILSGMGGDELFAGYPRHLATRIGRVTDVLPRSLRSGVRRALTGRIGLGHPGSLRGPRRNLMKLIGGLDAASTADRYLTYCSYYARPELDAVLSPDLRHELRGYDPLYRHRDYLHRVKGEDWLNQLLYLDIKTFLPCLNLTYTDKMSMAASTEVRVPLLDDELVELSGRIPPALKLRRMSRKYVLKRSQEGTLPKKVIWRPKAGFGAPVRSWLVGDLRPMVEEMLSPEAVSARGLLDPVEVKRLIRANDAGAEDNAMRIWAMLTLELWQREFLDRRTKVEQG